MAKQSTQNLLSKIEELQSRLEESEQLIEAIKAGEVLLPFRVMLVGGKFGPHVFDIAGLLGREETIRRIEKALEVFVVV